MCFLGRPNKSTLSPRSYFTCMQKCCVINDPAPPCPTRAHHLMCSLICCLCICSPQWSYLLPCFHNKPYTNRLHLAESLRCGHRWLHSGDSPLSLKFKSQSSSRAPQFCHLPCSLHSHNTCTCVLKKSHSQACSYQRCASW